MNRIPLTVGVPCRDEGQDFSLFAGGLRDALENLPTELPVEVLICVNGSAENFAERLALVAEASGLNDFKIRFIASPQGKLEAMKTIVQNRAFRGYLAFVDSDVVLEANVLRRLWEVLESDSQCMISYGQPVPIFPYQMNLIHRLSRVHYAMRERAYQRPYFHGRAFMLREWFFHGPEPARAVKPALAKRLRLENGPLVDDIALSLMAVSRWGTTSIREVQEANVFFDRKRQP
jgi:cellulose synthase/poly-beta-1,6-N-acetylglucosamine synthase-like glycosyltransferase